MPRRQPAPMRSAGSVSLARKLATTFAVLALVAAGCGGDDDDAAEAPVSTPAPPETVEETPSVGDIEGLVTFDNLGAGHETGDLDYDMFPPVGGDHNPFWQACGHYTVPVPEERAVHSMEHGAVWIAYTPGTDVTALESVVAADGHLLMSPLEGLATPIVVSAWEAQVAVDGPDDPRIAAFIEQFLRQGPEDAPCVGGGVGAPPTDVGPGLDV